MQVKIEPTKTIQSTALSHHSLRMLQECPAKLGYYKMRDLKTASNEAMMRGSKIHNYLASIEGLAEAKELLAPLATGHIKAEFSIALNLNLQKADYNKATFFRGRVDAGISNHAKKEMVIVDWKIGQLANADPLQLQAYGAYFQTLFPGWHIKLYLVKYPEGDIKEVELKPAEEVWEIYRAAHIIYTKGRQTGYWNATPGKHCEGCGALLTCPVHLGKATQPAIMQQVSKVLANVGTLPAVSEENLIPYLEAQYSLNLLYKAFKQATTNFVKGLKNPIHINYKAKIYRVAYEATERVSLRYSKDDVYNAALAAGIPSQLIKTASKEVEKAFADRPEIMLKLRGRAKEVKASRKVQVKEVDSEISE